MKLIFCPHCHDVIRMFDEQRKCLCGKSHGKYLNDLDAVYGGAAIPMGIDNGSLESAVYSLRNGFIDKDYGLTAFPYDEFSDDDYCPQFTAFLITPKCATFKKED